MARDNFSALLAFIAVAREHSFTRAAAQLRVSQPALSYTIRELEAKLGVRLLMRSTRNVSPTEAGQRLLDRLVPEFEQIEEDIQSLSELRDKPTGTLRITAIDYAIRSTLWPKLANFLPHYPDIHVELISEYESVDIVARGYDAGVRFGQELALDMISVRIGPDIHNRVVGSTAYFANRRLPKKPQDLNEHVCINLRTSTYGGLYEWEFIKGKQTINARVAGTVIFNNAYDILEAAKSGFGLAYLPEDMVRPYITQGLLTSVLEDWCPIWPGLHLYYPNRRQPSRAMALLVESLRHSV
ncbi:DNA-binding transcriptional LysR family regulator [Serratia fonticola]|uniref:DNA-binding transcriptional LysR family regulator n=1 Tax=Serratia fonticola TaxID=47917 RepID=A0A559TBE3_SERFO|nr:LysR family transcriptional regulator [Serratia fonticola]TQI80591.1 DNA-binding transcriptional LysR family regulator [Serratia fonticola]TQI97384.1 DNA-binding transcriptional LysR family regulator [Serratia fonticola]TVZ71880.1 DNA-binding transcriptional LysR family regulator [Serratia fonticola]